MNEDLENLALHFLGAEGSGELRPRVRELAAEAAEKYPPRWTYQVFSLDRGEAGITLRGTDLTLSGQTAERMLSASTAAAALACTLGPGFDTRLRALQARSMADAVMFDACGSALVEQGCDRAEEEIRARFPGRFFTDRFSPGYGDLPLSLQPRLCARLDTARRLGLHVTESLLLNPAKSVTALLGIAAAPQRALIRGCDWCTMRERCSLRKGGSRCGFSAS